MTDENTSKLARDRFTFEDKNPAGTWGPPGVERLPDCGFFQFVGVRVMAGVLLLSLTVGCHILQTAADVPVQTVRAVTPGKKDRQPVNPVEVQQAVFRLSDQFLARILLALESTRNSNSLANVSALRWKIAFATETTSIASGPNVIANLVDLTVFVSAARFALETHPQTEALGDSGPIILENCRDIESNLWTLVATILTKEQQAELREAIAKWVSENPLPDSLLAPRAVSVGSQIALTGPKDPSETESVFNFLKLDPLSGLDPAVREITQTRLFADRALYVSQKMPLLLRWQTELLSINTMNLPQVGQVITNSTLITAAIDRFASAAEKLPSQISTEREAILKALDAQEKSLSPMVKEVRQALDSGTEMSASLNITITNFDALMKRFGIGVTNTNQSTKTNSEPFRIVDYAQTARDLEAAAEKLTGLLVEFDQTLGSTNLTRLTSQLSPVIQQAESSGKQVANYTFWKCIILVVVVAAVAFLYRFVVARFIARTRA